MNAASVDADLRSSSTDELSRLPSPDSLSLSDSVCDDWRSDIVYNQNQVYSESLGKETVDKLNTALDGVREQIEVLAERVVTIEHMIESIYFSPGMPGYTNTAMRQRYFSCQQSSGWAGRNPLVLSIGVVAISSFAYFFKRK